MNAIQKISPAAASEKEILEYLATHEYSETMAMFNISKGSLYRLALKNGARKTEVKIRERAAERKARQKETLLEMIDQTVTADVLDYLDAIPDESVNLIMTSPPYNIGKSYGDNASADSMRHVYYAGWLTMIISEMARIIKPGGVIFLQCGSTQDELDGSRMPIDILIFDAMRKAGLTYQNRVSWIIPHGLTPKKRLSERHESCLIMSKGEPAVFNPSPARTPQKQPDKKAYKGPNKGKLSGHPQGAWPSDVWTIGNVGANHPEKTGHPAQFPEEMAKRAIGLYTLPGDLVVDPFSGSGTIHAVSRKMHRQFSGADLFYEDHREKRLKNVEPDNISYLPGVTDKSVAVWQAQARACGIKPEDIETPSQQEDLFGT